MVVRNKVSIRIYCMVELAEVKLQKPGGRAITRPVLTKVTFGEGERMHSRARGSLHSLH